MFIKNSIQEHQRVIAALDPLLPTIEIMANRMTDALQRGGKIFWMGNGGSAADAQHLAAELIGRFKKERKALASIALTTDSSVLTCLSNDYDYSIIFARQLEALCTSKDVVIGLTTSGNSLNILKGIEQAKKLNAHTIAMTGETGGKIKNLVDHCICIPSTTVARIQEAHGLIGHILCEFIEEIIVTGCVQTDAVL